MTHPTRPSTFRRFSLKPLPLALLLSMASAPAFSQGLTGVSSMVGGSATTANGHTVFTGTGKAGYIAADGFSLGKTESFTVNAGRDFNTLVQVTGSAASIIDGRITAAGGVWISNANGIMFGANSVINVGSLVASSLTIDRDDFLQGRHLFRAAPGQGDLAGQVVNKGRIYAPGGNIVLAGHQVTNEGLLSAPGGRVGLVASDEVLVDVEGDGLLFFNVKAGDAQTRLRQLGRVEADGGSAELMAAARGAFADTVLNMSGVVQARSVGTRNGRIVIDGGNDGVTQVSGTLDASGTGTGETGGRIAVLGDKVALAGQARLNASGDLGGGEVLVGGNVQGSGSERRASRSYVGKNVVITADALRLGDGGKVVVWADGDTRYFGHLSAQGGALGGNGGFAEVSGHEHLSYLGTADLSAAAGHKGQLLLDPSSIDIVATPAEADIDNANPTGDDLGSSTFAANSGSGSSKISAVAIKAQLELADVTLSASNDINVNAAIDASGNTTDRRLTLTAGDDINLGANITTRGGLTLNAGGSAVLDRINVTAANVTLDAGSGTLVLNGHVDGANNSLTLKSSNTAAAAIDMSNLVEDVASLTVDGRARISENITTSGAQSYSGTVVLNGGDVTLNANAGKITLSGAVDGTGRHLTLRSTSSDADAVKTSSTISNTDELTITGKSTLGGNVTTSGDQSYSADVALGSAAVTLDAGANKIALNGALAGNGQNLTLKSTNADVDAIKTTGAITDVAAFQATGKTTLNGNVTSTAGQTYGAALRLGANAVLDGGAGKVALNGAVDGNGRTLGLTSTNTDADAVKLGAAVTGVTALTVTGKSTLGANVTTTGLQTYTDAVRLGSTAVTLDAGANKIALNAAVDGNAQNLTLKSTNIDANAIRTGGAVSNVAVFTVTGKSTLGGDVTTTGTQSYSAGVTLDSVAVTLDAGASKVALNGAVNGNAQNLSLQSTHVDADAIKTTGAITDVAALTVTGKATIGNNVTTTGNQTYTAAVTLGSNPVTFDSGASKLAFQGAVDGNAKNLRLVSTHADADAISTGSTVSNVGATFTVAGKSTLGGNVTSGEQRYDGLVTLGANAILNAAGGNKIALNAGVDGNGKSLGLTSTNATADAIKTTGDIGGVTNLTVTGRSTLGGNVTTTGTQTYTGKTTLGTAANLQGTSLSLADLDATGVAIGLRANALTISGTVTGTGASTATFEALSNTGTISVAGGALTGPSTLQLSQALLNKFQNFGSITIGSTLNAYNIAFGDFVMPTATIVRSSTGNISFARLDGAKSLDARTTGVGTIALNDVVGGTDALASVLLNGVITLNTSAITTTGNQTYTGAVTLGAAPTTTLNAGGGKIDFSSTIDGNARNLALTSTNVAADAVKIAGTVEDVEAFTVTGKSTLGGNVTTTGNQTYSGIVKLGSTAVTLDAGAGKVALNGGADGSGQNLTLVSTNTAADAIKTGAAITNVAAFTATGKSTLGAAEGHGGAGQRQGVGPVDAAVQAQRGAAQRGIAGQRDSAGVGLGTSGGDAGAQGGLAGGREGGDVG
ncbi:MAG: filamentous hemagglutinin N-terminal domain-containing protein, partial [Rubrivivax sp.]